MSVPEDFEGEMQALLMTLEIYEEAIFRTRYEGGTAVATDEVSPFDVAAAFAGLEMGTGLLPERVLFHKQMGPEYRIGIYLPPERRRLRVVEGLGAEKYEVPCPALVFVGQGRQYQIYALATEGWPAGNTELCQAPFPNVHSSGGICQGEVTFPECRPETIHEAARLFFESEFNQHLRNRKSQSHEHNILALYRELERDGVETYPVEDLIELGRRVESLVQDA